MKSFWIDPPDPLKAPLAFFPRVWPVPGSSKVLIQFSRLKNQGNPDVRYHLVAEADGPVRHALLQVNPVVGGFYVQAQGLREGKYIWQMTGDTWDVPGFGDMGGFLAGDIDGLLPSTVGKAPKVGNLASNWDVSADWIVHNQIGLSVRSWSKPDKLKTQVFLGAQDPDGQPFSIYVPRGPDIFLGVGEGNYHGIMVWSQDQGLRPLQRWVGDYTRGAGNIGTDGKDLVWTYGEGKQPNDLDFPATSVFTAPYATDMATIDATKRRVRSDVSRPGDTTYQYVVGCGYAARRYFDYIAQTSELYLVRLSDGKGWKITGLPQGADHVYWSNPLAVSCEHVYVSLSIKKESNTIARIPLSSLGPGLPAD
ncbi:MAG: hypothetical protein MUF64_15205 [Polyangiaceae bacterium]|jgi:hypothetical protein|nr:hypothetical protein [Polyangiaceae bacterium]